MSSLDLIAANKEATPNGKAMSGLPFFFVSLPPKVMHANEISDPVKKVLVPEVTPSALAPGLPPVWAPGSKK